MVKKFSSTCVFFMKVLNAKDEFLTNYSCLSKIKVHSINIWTVKIKIAVVRLVKSLVIFILPSCYL
jgi:uncharacterized membrane protein